MEPGLITLLLVFQLLPSSSCLAMKLPFGTCNSYLSDLARNVSSRIFFNHGQQVPRSLLNSHEQWHHRYSVAFTNASSVVYVTMAAPTASVAYVTLSAPTGFLGTMSFGSSLPSASAAPANYSVTASLGASVSSVWASKGFSSTTTLVPSLSSATATGIYGSRLASVLGPLGDLQADKSADWDEQTESACSAALIALDGVATNPSGIAACYNIKSLESLTGKFEVDLRLYRISAPTDGWLKLNPSSVGVGLTYSNATISPIKAKKSKREDQSLPWFPAHRDEAADIYIRRSTGVPPRRIESMTFMGTVDHGAFVEMKDRTMALSLLTPAITLSGIEQDGTSLTTQLSFQDASFVNGVFATQGTEGSQSTTATDATDFTLPGIKLVGLPTGLIISTIWAVLYLLVMGYGTMSRYQARESYRRRVKRKFSGDAITKRRMRWA